MSADETKQRLSDYQIFLSLLHLVHADQSPASTEFRRMLDGLSEFLATATSRDIRERGKKLEAIFARAAEKQETLLPRKLSIREIARDFRSLLKTTPEIWQQGIQHGWLSDRFDTSKLPQMQDLPRHARIGIGMHACRVAVEEVFLLQDTFFLLVRARSTFETMMRHADLKSKTSTNQDNSRFYRELSALNTSVCTYSRLGVLTAAAFVETFVNSVGWNEAALREDLSEQERAELRGIRKDRYLSLESKLERIPPLIRSDKNSPIILSDQKQRREPFISFLAETKEIRDASMHFAPGKTTISRPPGEWLHLVERAAMHAIAVASEFWTACYPGRKQPRYLASLYYDGLVQEALDRLADTQAVAENI